MTDQSRLEIVVDSRTAEGNVRSVRRELEQVEGAGLSAQRSARSAAGGIGALAKQAQLAVPPIGQMTQLLAGLTGIIGTRQIIAYSDEWNNAGNQLRQVTNSADELAGTQERLLGIANATRSDFSATANLYARLARSTDQLGLSQDDLIGLTRTINQSFAVSGATAGEAAAAITQLSQGLAAGALRGDEFNSVSEQAPGIMRAIAAELDMTTGELRAFAAEGGITAEIVVSALQSASRSIEQDFGQSVATFGQQMTVARNNLIQFVGSADSVEDALSNLGGAAITLSENLDAVAQAGIVLGGVIGGRIAGRMITLAAGMTTAAGAATALRTALAFLGGPAGILVAVGAGIFAFREELGLVPGPAKTVAENLDEITQSLEGLSGAMLDTQVAAFGAELVQIGLQAERLEQRISSLKEAASSPYSYGQGQQGDVTEGLARAQAEQEGLSNRAEAIEQAIAGIRDVRSGLGGDSGSGGTAEGDLSLLVPTREQAGAAESVENLAEKADDGAEAINDFAGAAEAGARRITAATRDFGRGALGTTAGMEPEQDNGRLSVRQRIEAGKDLSPYWLEPNPNAKSTYGTALDMYDAAGSTGFGRGAPGNGAPSGQPGPNLGTLTLAKEGGGKIDVQANADELRKWLGDELSGAASAV